MEKDFRNCHDRQKRKLAAERKRFCEPLKIFLERKYSGIYKEYMKLFSCMDAEAPRKKDLTRTKVFEKWLDENQGPVVLFTPRVVLERMTVQPQVSASPSGNEVNKSLEDEADAVTHAIREPGAGGDMEILQGLQEVLAQEGVHMSWPELQECSNLGYFDEIEKEIQPFDYALEVEPYDF